MSDSREGASVTRYAVIVATCGDGKWADLAWERAVPSAEKQHDGNGDRPQLVVEHFPELTLAAARNAAAARSTADWLIFLDADDELEETFLCELDCVRGAVLADEELVPPLLVPAVRRLYPEGDSTYLYSPTATIPQRGRWPELNECVIGTAVHRQVFAHVGGFRERTLDGTELSSIEDYDLWLRCFDAGARLVYAPEAVYRAYVSSSSRNRDQSPYAAIWADHLARIAA